MALDWNEAHNYKTANSLSSTTDKIFNTVSTCTTACAQLQNPICMEPFCFSLPHAFSPFCA